MIGIFILIIMSVVAIFVYSNTYAIVFGILGAVIFSVMLMANLQMVMGGKKHQIRPEDWVAAALLIYLDIINIFQYVLLASAAGGR
jgi:FtsH-binding integral membrane protein